MNPPGEEGHGWDTLLSGAGSALTVAVLWLATNIFKRKDRRSGEVSEKVAEAKTDARTAARLDTHASELERLGDEMRTYWTRHDELAQEVRSLDRIVAGIPDRAAAAEMERRIVDAIHSQGSAFAEKMAEHVYHYHAERK